MFCFEIFVSISDELTSAQRPAHVPAMHVYVHVCMCACVRVQPHLFRAGTDKGQVRQGKLRVVEVWDGEVDGWVAGRVRMKHRCLQVAVACNTWVGEGKGGGFMHMHAPPLLVDMVVVEATMWQDLGCWGAVEEPGCAP